MAILCPHGGGQWGVDGGTHFCQSRPKSTIGYDKARLTPLQICSSKILIGEGAKTTIRRIGLHIGNSAGNLSFRIDDQAQRSAITIESPDVRRFQKVTSELPLILASTAHPSWTLTTTCCDS